MPPKKGTVKRPDLAARNRARAKKSSPPPGGRVPDAVTFGETVPPAATYEHPEPPPLNRASEDTASKPDMEDEFITSEEAKERWTPSKTPTPGGKTPAEPGFIAEMIAGLGQKIHETEYGLTGHPVFIHGEADERIWKGLGKYVESQLDPSKYGVVILLVVLVGSETMKLAVWGGDLMKKRKPRKEVP